MLFDELYESCFRNASLVKVPNGKPGKDDASLLVTLDHVMSNSQYVVFFLTAGIKGADIGLKLDNMIRKKNERGDKDKPHNSPARIRRFFSMKKKKKSGNVVSDPTLISVILIDTDYRSNSDESGCSQLAQPGWYVYAPQLPATKSRLLRALGFEFSPSLIIVDAGSRSIVTTEGRRLLADDINGTSFPWWPPSVSEVLNGNTVRRVNGAVEMSDFSAIKATVRGLLFGAQWCPPCRQWVKQLAPVYEKMKARGISLEIVFCSSDRTQEAFDQFTTQMPWLSFAYDPAKTIALTRVFNVSGIPSLILLDSSGRVITNHGRSSLLEDVDGTYFPWGPRPLYELNEFTVCRLRDEPSLILFTEGSPDDIQFSLSVMDALAKRLFEERLRIAERRVEDPEKKSDENSEPSNGISKSASSEECSSLGSDLPIPPQADPLQLLYTGEDPICDHILESILGLGDVELPLICIVDGLAGQLCVCERPDVSEAVLNEFVNEYRAGRLQWAPLPAATQSTTKSVGSIPGSVIEQAIISNSPSQNSLSGAKEEVKTV
ncbi:hypothetical protein KIN20_004211 [Parelaphostrongylus tenuis]|uniref:Thioredoxin-like fold domain-containing protein n=1 Tax=Parelaphostrongylus tenuis TaxID=148309 RepID=A0AAD5MGX0_PARTN|nr:hypothetical protein KIN20_004211 [Parelaphostrongylus tenuis]